MHSECYRKSVGRVIVISISLIRMAFFGELNVSGPEILAFQENLKTFTGNSLKFIDKLKIYYILDGFVPKSETSYDAPILLENLCIVAAGIMRKVRAKNLKQRELFLLFIGENHTLSGAIKFVDV